jgi:hypothetical protein
MWAAIPQVLDLLHSVVVVELVVPQQAKTVVRAVVVAPTTRIKL